MNILSYKVSTKRGHSHSGKPADTSKWFALLVGLAHFSVQAGLVVGCWFLAWFAVSEASDDGSRFWLLAALFAIATVLMFIAMLAGPYVLALYLRLADNFQFHENELFSAMQIMDFKSHLRLEIQSSGMWVTCLGFPTVSTEEPLAHQEPEQIEQFWIARRPTDAESPTTQ